MVTWQSQEAVVQTLYTVEYVTDKKAWEKICGGKHPAPWELYEKKTFDSLDEALTFYLVRMMDKATFEAKLFEAISVDGKALREAYIEPSGPVFYGMQTAIDRDMRSRLDSLERRTAAQDEELADYYGYISERKLGGDFKAYREANKKV
ncbi:MAG: hypothetical protein NC548_58270 [Lachnospiraceae bacterium]|nr:hypothetical protein [Lachnospiraceae bacterium]